jgi:hypothetical protein
MFGRQVARISVTTGSTPDSIGHDRSYYRQTAMLVGRSSFAESRKAPKSLRKKKQRITRANRPVLHKKARGPLQQREDLTAASEYPHARRTMHGTAQPNNSSSPVSQQMRNTYCFPGKLQTIRCNASEHIDNQNIDPT